MVLFLIIVIRGALPCNYGNYAAILELPEVVHLSETIKVPAAL